MEVRRAGSAGRGRIPARRDGAPRPGRRGIRRRRRTRRGGRSGAAATGDFDVELDDIMLPGLSGYQVLRELRARHVWTPVLMLSAKDGEYDLADALDLGADYYLTKPF